MLMMKIRIIVRQMPVPVFLLIHCILNHLSLIFVMILASLFINTSHAAVCSADDPSETVDMLVGGFGRSFFANCETPAMGTSVACTLKSESDDPDIATGQNCGGDVGHFIASQ